MPYVAWTDDSNNASREIYVRHWNGSSWEEVGAGSASGGGISNNGGDSAYPSIAISADGVPYVAWSDDSSGDYEIYVRRWDGSSWEEVGTGSAFGGGLSNNDSESRYPSIAVAPNGKPFVVWDDNTFATNPTNYEIYIRRWNGSSWEEVGTGSATEGGISNNGGSSASPSIVISAAGVPYVAWSDDSNLNFNYEIYVRRWQE
jgi:hypothetical protein